MKPEDIERDKAILAAATARPWIAVQPRSQEGGPQIAAFGPAFAGPDGFLTATSVRMAGPAPQTDKEFADIVQAESLVTWEQHEANAVAAVHAVNRMPLYIAEAEETWRRVSTVKNWHDAAVRHAKRAKSDPSLGDGPRTEREIVAAMRVDILGDVLKILSGEEN